MLLQQHADMWQPVAFASRSMTDTERRYSQIEKEALAPVWACEKFGNYVIGKDIALETDHKPLVPLLGKTNLDCLPPRVLRFQIRLMRFSYTICHVPGKQLYTVDTLSRAPVATPDSTHLVEDSRTERLLLMLCHSFQPVPTVYTSIAQHSTRTPHAQNSLSFASQDGPARTSFQDPSCHTYWPVRELTLHNDLLLCGRRIVVPRSLQRETLAKVHTGHQGIHRYQSRVLMSVW